MTPTPYEKKRDEASKIAGKDLEIYYTPYKYGYEMYDQGFKHASDLILGLLRSDEFENWFFEYNPDTADLMDWLETKLKEHKA